MQFHVLFGLPSGPSRAPACASAAADKCVQVRCEGTADSRPDPDLEAVWQAAVAVLGVADCQRYWGKRGRRPLETGLPGVSAAADDSEEASLLGSKGCLGSTTAQDTVPLCRRATRLLLKCLRSLRQEFDQVVVWYEAYVAQGDLAEAQREREIAEHHFAFVSVNTPVGDVLR
ncbi:MAG: hypothetical protein KVP17_003065 [Porospora cf. gigantea B]|uniref:uncharacterized protein n=1 Tax=Porospora cf. gigantea B TaxID=2853592 RepID=UPI003571B980|nr:MAG: hypothetical protein KVP17_003065 [Porospora cf. gigantea B]